MSKIHVYDAREDVDYEFDWHCAEIEIAECYIRCFAETEAGARNKLITEIRRVKGAFSDWLDANTDKGV